MNEPAETMPDPCVYVVDDDAGMRDSLGALLEAKGYDYRLLESGEALLDVLNGTEAGCVLLDYSMAGMDGLATLRALRERGIAIPVILITAHGDVELAVKAMRAGASDFIEKPWNRAALFDTLERAIEQDRNTRELAASRRNAREIIASFTPREKDVFDQLITGASNKLVARALDLSPRTVEFYRANVLEKSGVSGVAGLVRLAFMAREIEL